MPGKNRRMYGMGIIGAGLIGKHHALAIRAIPNARLVAVCDTAEDRARALASAFGARVFTDYREMLAYDDLDVVTVATPSGLHRDPVIAAAEAGKSVLCEKPLEIDLGRTDAMIEAHRRANTQLGAILPLRFDDLYQPLEKAVREHRFGKITCITVHVPWWRTQEYYRNSWRGTWAMDGGGAVMNQGIHLIDLLCHFMPPVESIHALTATLAHPEIETEDTAVAICRFQGGALGMIQSATSSYPGRPTRIEITGERGTAVIQSDRIAFWQFACDDERPEDLELRARFQEIRETGGQQNPGDISFIRHQRNFEAFLQALDANQPFFLSGPEARKSIALIMALYESARSGAMVILSA